MLMTRTGQAETSQPDAYHVGGLRLLGHSTLALPGKPTVTVLAKHS
jgi:hypothetical protein